MEGGRGSQPSHPHAGQEGGPPEMATYLFDHTNSLTSSAVRKPECRDDINQQERHFNCAVPREYLSGVEDAYTPNDILPSQSNLRYCFISNTPSLSFFFCHSSISG